MAEFKGKRYLTRGVANDIPLLVQLAMWQILDEAIQAGQEMDYLQVFQLSDKDGYQQISYSQEVPPVNKQICFRSGEKPVTAKVFVIDSEEYVTMLLSEEY